MSEIENAIEQFEELKDDNYSHRSLPSSWSIELAISALRAQQEREKGCEYCNGPDTEYGVISFPRTESGEIDINQVEVVAARVCPMCGRELKDVQDER